MTGEPNYVGVRIYLLTSAKWKSIILDSRKSLAGLNIAKHLANAISRIDNVIHMRGEV